MFRIGDKVVHPMHGAGVIDGIVSEKVGPARQDYYVFKMPVGGLVLKIPVATSQIIGLRKIVSAEEADALIASISSMQVRNSPATRLGQRLAMCSAKSAPMECAAM